MKNGGIYGGWDQSDHQAFLKVRHICLFPATEWSILKYVVARESSSIDLPSICINFIGMDKAQWASCLQERGQTLPPR